MLKTCPADQGCGATGCVPACDSAKDNKSTIGCDYYSVDPDIIDAAAGSCFAAFVANTWTAPVTLQVERAGQILDAAKFSYLPSGTGQSITYTPLPNGQLPGAGGGGVPRGVWLGLRALPAGGERRLHDRRRGGARHHDGRRAPPHLQRTGGGLRYLPLRRRAVGGDERHAALADDGLGHQLHRCRRLPQEHLRAAGAALDRHRRGRGRDDGDHQPDGGDRRGPDVPATGKGVPQTYNLNKGQILQFTQDAELIGSPIQSNKPIGLWGGASCLSIDVGQQACDSAHQQIPPVKALGHEYVAVRYRNRFDGQEESPPWRLVGAVDGTMLTYEPAPPMAAPLLLKAGQVAEFRAAGPFTIKSQDEDHPFYMSAHMTGCTDTNPNGDDCRGDPEFVNVIPPQQYLSSYVFFTDPTYPETNLVLVRSKTAQGFQDVTLDCAGKLDGWQALGSSGQYEYLRTDLVRHNFQGQGGCDNGRHEIHSNAPFGLVVWGWGTAETGGCFGSNCGGFYSQAVSYAYPAGASIQPINTVVVPAVPK